MGRLTFNSLVHPDFLEQGRAEYYNRVNQKASTSQYEFKGVKKDGVVLFLEVDVDALIEENRVTGWRSYVRDITERKQIEEALKESELKYRSLFEQAADSILLIDAENGAIVDFNDAAHNILGYSREEFANLRIADFEVIESPEEIQKHLEKIQIEGSDSFETLHRTKDGSIIYVYVNTRAVTIKGKIFFQSIFRDITELKKAEEELLKFKTIADNVNSGAAICDMKGNLTYVNEYYAFKHGYKPEELLGKNTAILYNEEQMLAVHACMEELLQSGTFGVKEMWHTKKDGSVFPMLMSATVIKDKDNLPVCMGVTAIDVSAQKQLQAELRKAHDGLEGKVAERTAELSKTNELLIKENAERKRAEAALRESELWMHNIFNSLEEAVLVVTPERTLISLNYSAQKMFGYSMEELNNLTTEVLHVDHDHYLEFGKMIKTAFDKDETANFKFRAKRKSGIIFPTEHTVSLLKNDSGESIGIVSVIRDITERMRAEEELNESKERFRLAALSASDLIYEWDIATDRLDWYGDIDKALGFESGEFPGTLEAWLKQIHPDDQARVKDSIKFHMESTNIINDEYRIRRKDGSWRNWLDQGMPVLDSNGHPSKWIGACIDITERIKVEEALKASEASLSNAQRIAHVGNWEWDIEKNQLSWSDEIYRIFGLFPHEFKATYEAFLSFVHPDDREFVTKSVNNALNEHKPYSIEHRIKLPNGEERFVHEQAEITFDVAGKPVQMIGTVQDITKLKTMETAVRESEKLAATGRMAARIAHEINNPLAGIKNSFALVKNAIPEDHKYFDYVVRIDKEIERIARIVHQMYEIYRPNREVPQNFVISDTIQDIIALLEPSYKAKEIAMQFDSKNDSSSIFMSEGLFKQVMYNIIQNAIDASPLKKVVKVDLILSDTTIQITVRDQGDGIPDSHRSRIFEPFFTTKENMKNGGLGLGLPICKGIIEKLNGSLDFICEPNKGTVFRITLPLSRKLEEVEIEK